jgi:hypothetical protein
VERTVLVALRKQRTDVQPQAAIMAFRTRGIGVRLQANMRVDGDVWARGRANIQQGVQVDGQVHEQIEFGLAWSQVKPQKLTRYWTPGGDEYHSYDLAAVASGNWNGNGYGPMNGPNDDGDDGDGDEEEDEDEDDPRITLRNIVLGPDSDNPRGVYFFDGSIVVGDNVLVQGTLVATGSIIINGSDVHLAAVVPSAGSSPGDPGGSGQAASLFPVLLASRHIKIRSTAHDVAIEGVVVAKRRFIAEQVRQQGGDDDDGGGDSGGSGSSNPGGINEDIYIRGALQANRVYVRSRPPDSFAVIFDPQLTDLTDAPGFFAWRVVEWRQD